MKKGKKMDNFLDQILACKREEVAAARRRLAPLELIRRAMDTPKPRGFIKFLTAGRAPRIIAEIKRKSPSKGNINPGLDAVEVARTYEEAGAAAISVLTDKPRFGGSLDDLSAVRKAVSLPLLRKDFIIDPYQIWEARLHGADAALLIVAALPWESLKECMKVAKDAGLDTLVEAHTQSELTRAMDAKAKLIGLNSRNLRTFNVDRTLAIRLRPQIPENKPVVVESGIKSRADIDEYMSMGYNIFLIGEALTGAPDIGEALRDMVGKSPARPRKKVYQAVIHATH